MRVNKKNKATFRKYLNDTYTKQEAKDSFQGFSLKENMPIIEELSKEMWNDSLQLLPEKDDYRTYSEEAEKILSCIERPPRIHTYRRLLIYGSSLAAVLMLAIGCVLYLRSHVKDQLPQISYIQRYTSNGETKRIVLPDGSIVILNSCSSISYPAKFMGNKRMVKLHGEGFFKVLHKEANPFIVQASNLKVCVLGTQFDVKSYVKDRIVSVGVNSGRVKVYTTGAVVFLDKHERIICNKSSGELEKQHGIPDVALWLQGSLQFDDTPIQEVACELERVYNCRIIFRKGEAFNYSFSGTHDNKSLESVLNSIKFVTGVKYKKLSNNIIEFYR